MYIIFPHTNCFFHYQYSGENLIYLSTLVIFMFSDNTALMHRSVYDFQYRCIKRSWKHL